VTVYRNDEITLEELIAKEPTQLVISPGPGHPATDSGISCHAITHFSGKIPVFGVCMGEQCIFAAFGGKVDVTGEILHGKTSPLAHDGKGLYAGLPQNLPVTRYHSLAGTHATLPDCLEISAWVAGGPDEGKGIIMGVRHRELLVEGVQFHPESILTEEGMVMLRNFLAFHGGTWAENEAFHAQNNLSKQPDNLINGYMSAKEKPTAQANILEKIYQHRRKAVEEQKNIPSQRPADLEEALRLDLAPPAISFGERLRHSPYTLSLLAEIKRASPSKGPIGMNISVPGQARKYALAGASAISVLTEPEWFKGSVDDLRVVRRSLEGMPNRPAVLRKEFIFDEYQILEARLAGADTILLIVKMLDEATLTRLYKYSVALDMEPLVEVNTAEEMEIALRLGAKVIGVNNRNLTSFEVDLGTTSRLMERVPESTVVLALSGINGPNDVQAYRREGVAGVLVGEALMRAPDVPAFVSALLGGGLKASHPCRPLVKICGTRTPQAARVAIEAGADLIGIILVDGRRRCVSNETAKAISKVVHDNGRLVPPETPFLTQDHTMTDFFENSAFHLWQSPRPLLVGVFQNQPLSYILSQQRQLNLDIVQLHGNEPLEWAHIIPVPVFRRFGPSDAGLTARGHHLLPLVDTASGGTGEMVDISRLEKRLEADPGLRVVLAGGLTPANVAATLKRFGEDAARIVAVDVSSGVEVDGNQSHHLIWKFVRAVKDFDQ
jgi:anthranilate synthase / indole-3-glycerol phosphate synthase / phosphoribosylanthranilate isomerase